MSYRTFGSRQTPSFLHKVGCDFLPLVCVPTSEAVAVICFGGAKTISRRANALALLGISDSSQFELLILVVFSTGPFGMGAP